MEESSPSQIEYARYHQFITQKGKGTSKGTIERYENQSAHYQVFVALEAEIFSHKKLEDLRYRSGRRVGFEDLAHRSDAVIHLFLGLFSDTIFRMVLV
jgi:hypothetical protein